MTLAQFLMFVDVEAQLSAQQRISFVSDLGIVAGSMYSKANPLGEHIDLLTDESRGAKPWLQKQN